MKFSIRRTLLLLAISTLSVTIVTGCSSTSARKAARLDREAAAREKLLALIPENHPQRADLRVLAHQPAPDGFSSEAWLELAQKVQFNSGATGSGRGESNLD